MWWEGVDRIGWGGVGLNEVGWDEMAKHGL